MLPCVERAALPVNAHRIKARRSCSQTVTKGPPPVSAQLGLRNVHSLNTHKHHKLTQVRRHQRSPLTMNRWKFPRQVLERQFSEYRGANEMKGLCSQLICIFLTPSSIRSALIQNWAWLVSSTIQTFSFSLPCTRQQGRAEKARWLIPDS